MRIILFVSFFLSALQVLSQTEENYGQALAVLEKAREVMGSIPPEFTIKAKGTIHYMGHYETPEKRIDRQVDEVYGFFGAEKVSYLLSEMQVNGKTYRRVAISKLDSVYDYGYYDKKYSKALSAGFLFEVAKAFPASMLELCYNERQSLRYLGERSNYHLLSFVYGGNKVATLFISQPSFLLEKVETMGYHPIYGDVVYSTIYKDFVRKNDIMMPSARIDSEFGQTERELVYGGASFDVKPDTVNLKIKWVPKPFRKKAMEPLLSGDKFEFSSISPGLDLIKITSQNNKMLVSEYSDYICLFEVPKGLNMSLQLMGELKKRYPNKPLRYLFVTHHHPDHAGGIKAYAGLDVTLVTTEGNREYFLKVLNVSHTLGTDALPAGDIKMKLEYVPLKGEKTFKGKGNPVVAYEIGPATTHTDEHLVFYFPQSKVLWTGDLLFFDLKETVYDAGARAKSVLELIHSKKLQVDRIYTSWPLHEQKDFGTVDFLKRLVVSN